MDIFYNNTKSQTICWNDKNKNNLNGTKFILPTFKGIPVYWAEVPNPVRGIPSRSPRWRSQGEIRGFPWHLRTVTSSWPWTVTFLWPWPRWLEGYTGWLASVASQEVRFMVVSSPVLENNIHQHLHTYNTRRMFECHCHGKHQKDHPQYMTKILSEHLKHEQWI